MEGLHPMAIGKDRSPEQIRPQNLLATPAKHGAPRSPQRKWNFQAGIAEPGPVRRTDSHGIARKDGLRRESIWNCRQQKAPAERWRSHPAGAS